MNKKISIILLLLLIIMTFFPITLSYATNPFGGSSTDSTTGTTNSESTIISSSAANGNDAAKKANKFENPGELNDRLNDLFGLIRYGIAILSTFGAITSFVIFAMVFIRLAAAPESPMLRRQVMNDILQSGIATVVLGGLSLVTTIFYKTFMGFISNTVMLSVEYKTAIAMALIEYKYLICGILGVLSLTMFVIFIKDVMMLASSGGNPSQRAHAIKGLLITGLATMGLGGTGIFVAMFNNLLVF